MTFFTERFRLIERVAYPRRRRLDVAPRPQFRRGGGLGKDRRRQQQQTTEQNEGETTG
ncbi:MAG: hypothetical protein HC826_00120 [Rhodospirillales bacterium]|nr:hypothetical protein [Rhodospirillales bacterium]